MQARATMLVREEPCEVEMSPTEPNSTQAPTVSDRQLVLIVYLLYLATYIFGITALVGVIIAHIKLPEAAPPLRSHFDFQIRTFWIGLLYLAVGAVLISVFPVSGVVILVWWLIWSLVRNVKGLLALNDNKPILNPASWLFG